LQSRTLASIRLAAPHNTIVFSSSPPASATAAPLIAPPSARARDLRFDTVRGTLLIMMAINHVSSDLRVWVDQPFGFVSAAEGFVFLSGILSGRIDASRSHLTGELTARARNRSWHAYVWHAIALIGTWLLVQAWVSFDQTTPWGLPYLFHHEPLTGLVSGLALLYQPGLLDILPMYVGFPFLVPLVLRLHRQNRGLLVWLASGVIWACDQWLSPGHPIEWGPINTGAFHFLSWQWLFVSGVLLGAEPAWERKAISRPPRWTLLAATAGVLFLWAVRRPELPNWWDLSTLDALTQKTPLAALRLLNFGLLAYLLGVLGSRRPAWLSYRPLATLGRHSLPVFTATIWCAQIALCFPEAGDVAVGRWLETAFVLVGMIATAATFEFLRLRSLGKTNPAG